MAGPDDGAQRQYRTFTVISASGACLYHDVVGTKGCVDEGVLAAFKNTVDSFADRVKRVVEQRLEHNTQTARQDLSGPHQWQLQQQQQQQQRQHDAGAKGQIEGTVGGRKRSRNAQSILDRQQSRGTFSFGEDRFVFQPIEAFVFIINAPHSSGETAILRQLEDLVEIFVLLFGPPEKWKPASLRLGGIKSMIDKILLSGVSTQSSTSSSSTSSTSNDGNSGGDVKDGENAGGTMDLRKHDAAFRERTRSLLGGVPFVSMSSQTHEHVDQLLALLENDNSTLGGVLLVEGSVLHSRLDLEETSQLWNLLQLQPLVYQRTRVTPVYSENQWKNLVVYRMRWHTLCVLQTIECSLVDTLPKLERFDHRLSERMNQLQIPIAATVPQLDELSGMQTLALAFHSVEEGRTLVPSLRDDATTLQYGRAFEWFMQRARDQMQLLAVSQVQLCKAGYRFFASEENGYEVYLLCGSECTAADIEDEADHVVTQIRMTQSV